MEKLKEYIQQIRGVSYKPSDSLDILKEGYIPLLRANNINNGKINFKNLIYVKKEKVKDIQYLKKGDILICTSSGSKELVGKAGLIKEDTVATFGAFCKVIRLKECCNYNYFNHYFQSNYYKNMIQKSSNGANINNLKTENFDNLSVNLLSYEEQMNIANKLDKVQEIIDIKKKQIEELDRLIKSQFVEIFKGCERKKLCNIADIIMGQSPNSDSYNDNEYGIPFFQGKADYGDKYTIVRHWTNKPSKTAQKGDVLMSVRAPVGPVNISSCNCCIGRGLCSISAKERLTNNEFLYNALNILQDEIASMGSGSTFKAITKNDVYNIELPVGTIELQNQFAEFVKLIDKQKFKIQKSLEETQKLQESLMNKYFS